MRDVILVVRIKPKAKEASRFRWAAPSIAQMDPRPALSGPRWTLSYRLTTTLSMTRLSPLLAMELSA